MADKIYDSHTSDNFFNDQNYSSTATKLNKIDVELYDESKAVAGKIIRVKRMGAPNKKEKWRILINDELTFVLEGDKLSKKEKTFLRSVEGMNWLIEQAKLGFKSFNELRIRLKEKCV